MKKRLRERLATVFSWVFVLPTISSTFWLPMWVALTLIFPTVFNYFPETPNPIRVPWIPQWFFRILYIPWIPFTLVPGSEWITEFLYLPELWTNSQASLFIELVRPWILVGGLFLFLGSLVQLLWSKYRGVGLVTTRFYSIVRHPQYLGIFIWVFGHLLYSLPFHLRPADILASVTLLFLYIALAGSEETTLKKKYGEKYEHYRGGVPFLVPFMRPNVLEKLNTIHTMQKRRKSIILISVYMIVVVSILGLTYGRTYLYWEKAF